MRGPNVAGRSRPSTAGSAIVGRLGRQGSSLDKVEVIIAANPEAWAHCHTEYRRLRESWTVVPFKEIRWLAARPPIRS